jgi:sugar lactone lactonase YvrE/acetyl esterase/lipase
MKKYFVVIALFLSATTFAQQNEILLWPNGAPGTTQTSKEKVRLYEGEHVISNIHNPSITPFLPAKEKANGTAIIIAPGGGHRELWIDHEGYNEAKWFSERGIAAFVLKYRLARDSNSTYTIDEHELADMQRAIRLVRSRATEWGIDTARIGVMGFSAGGEVAGLSAMRFDYGKENATDPIDKFSCRPSFQALIYPGGTARLDVAKNAPPVFLLAGYNDRADIAEGIAQLYIKYKKAAVPAELHVYANANHGFGLRERNKGAMTGWPARLQEWLIDIKMIRQDLQAELILDSKAMLGEGSIWHPKENKLYWIDIEGKALHIYDPNSKEDKQFPVGSRIGTVVPVEKEGVLVALQNGIQFMDTKSGKLNFINNPLPDTNLRFNDGKCDPSGRFWVGTLALDSRRRGAKLYRFDKDKSIHTMLDSVSISNGIVWTADKKTMYYNDTPTGTIQGFDYDDKTGAITNRRVVVRIPRGTGSPDGMTIDAEGNLWVALWGGGCVAKFDPRTGELLQKVKVPAPNVSSCAFGGENLETLYITTARAWVNDARLKEFPLSGGLFAVKPGVKGVPAEYYKGKL